MDFKLIHTIDIRQTKGLILMNILAVIILIAALGGGALKLKGDINSSKTILTGKLNDLSAFPNGSWPKATLAS